MIATLFLGAFHRLFSFYFYSLDIVRSCSIIIRSMRYNFGNSLFACIQRTDYATPQLCRAFHNSPVKAVQIRRAYSAINNYKAPWPPSRRDCTHTSRGYIALNKDMKYSCCGESTALVNFAG